MFETCKNPTDLKTLYRSLAKLLHPDKGGSTDLMTRLTQSYEYHLSIFEEFANSTQRNSKKQQSTKTKEPELKGDYLYVNKIVKVDNEAINIIYEMQEKKDQVKDFDDSFLESIAEYLEEHGYVTVNQYNALVKIYERFRFYEYE